MASTSDRNQRRELCAAVAGALAVASVVALVLALGRRPPDVVSLAPADEVLAAAAVPFADVPPSVLIADPSMPTLPVPAPVSRPTPPPSREQAPSASAVPKSPAEVRDAVAKGVRVSGEFVFSTHTQHNFNNSTTYHQWLPRVRIVNATPFPVALGNDQFFFESDGSGLFYNGVAVFRRPLNADVTTQTTYGLDINYEWRNEEGKLMGRKDSGSTFSLTLGGYCPADFGTIRPGKVWAPRQSFDQGTWLRDDLRARLIYVLPELNVRVGSHAERFRLVAQFQKPKGQHTSWRLGDQRLIPIDIASLRALLASSEGDVLLKVLAANWLAQAFPGGAAAAFAEIAPAHPDGPLCVALLELMTGLKREGMAPLALSLLGEGKNANGIRRRAALYLGRIRHGSALGALKAAASESDDVVALGAVAGLGDFGGADAARALAALWRAPAASSRSSEIASALAKIKSPEAVKALLERARDGDGMAIRSLADAGAPEAFDFFVEILNKPPGETGRPAAPSQQKTAGEDLARTLMQSLMQGKGNRLERSDAVRGLRSTGGEKALPLLLAMLAPSEGSRGTPADRDADAASELAELDSPKATPRLVELARKNNLFAARALARSKNESVREPLTTLASKSAGEIQRTALDGLANHWAAASFDVFVPFLRHADAKIVSAAVRGLGRGKSPEAAALLLPMLGHKDFSVALEVEEALASLPLDKVLPELAAAVLATKVEDLRHGVVSLLIASDWQDPRAIPKLGQKLAGAKGHGRYQIIQLLRHLSDDALGPVDGVEFDQDADGWSRKWIEWIARRENAR